MAYKQNVSSSPVGYAFGMCGSNAFPASSTTYYMTQDAPLNTTDDFARSIRVIPVAGTLNVIQGWFRAASAGSSENSTFSIYKNGVSVATITSTLKFNVTTQTSINTSGLGISVSAGDYIQLVLVTPSFTSLPGAIYWINNFLIE